MHSDSKVGVILKSHDFQKQLIELQNVRKSH
jgi:hypothetical protein